MTCDTQVVVWLPWASIINGHAKHTDTHTHKHTHRHTHTQTHTHTHTHTHTSAQGRRILWTMQTNLFITKTGFSEANNFQRNKSNNSTW